MPNAPAIEALLKVHSVDVEIARLTFQRDGLALPLRRIEADMQRQRRSLDQKRRRVEHLRTRIHGHKADIASFKEEIDRVTNKRDTARTNKEFARFEREIAAKKAYVSRMGDQLNTMMGGALAAEDSVREMEDRIAQLEHEHTEEGKALPDQFTEFDGRIGALQKDRVAATNGVESSLLEEYERIAARKGAWALAPVVNDSCQGCFTQLPTGLCETLRGGHVVVRCPSCSRFLYEPHDFIAQEKPEQKPDLQPQIVPWQILPPGEAISTEVIKHFDHLQRQGSARRYDADRLRRLLTLKPTKCYVGMDEFEGYVVFCFEGTDRAVLDNPLVGNAVYILAGDWRVLSALTKRELLQDHRDAAIRVTHQGDWFERVRVSLAHSGHAVP